MNKNMSRSIDLKFRKIESEDDIILKKM